MYFPIQKPFIAFLENSSRPYEEQLNGNYLVSWRKVDMSRNEP